MEENCGKDKHKRKMQWKKPQFLWLRRLLRTAADKLCVLKKLRWQNFILLLIAGCINAVGVTMFLSPVNLYDSGISGTSMLLWQITPEQFTFWCF